MNYMEALKQIKIEMDNNTSDDKELSINSITNEERHKFMSDPNIKYVVIDNIIHDKLCENVKGTSNEFLNFYKKYQHHFKQCPNCAVNAYIRTGAEDFCNYEKYINFYYGHRLYGKGIKKLYITNKCTTKLDTGVLTIKNRKDTWKIIDLGKDDMVKLMHNNYIINSKSERSFIGGFHVQSERINFNNALDKIYNYDCNTNPRNHILNEADRIEKNNRKKYKKLSFLKKLEFKLKKFLIKRYNLDGEIYLKGFRKVEDYGYPKHNQICTYLWETDSGDRYWMLGSYSLQNKLFHTSFNGLRKNVKQENVVAWKPMSDDEFRVIK